MARRMSNTWRTVALSGATCPHAQFVPDATLQPRSVASGTPIAAPVDAATVKGATPGAEQQAAGSDYAPDPAATSD